jgi:hypothetical protein
MIKQRILSGIGAATLALAIWIAPTPSSPLPAHSQVDNGRVVAQAIGRLVTRSDGTLELLGLYPSITGLGAGLFHGPPGEATALFTLRSSPIALGAIVPNLSIGHATAVPATGDAIRINVYYDQSPDQDYAQPDTFSDGQLVATYLLPRALVTISPTETRYVGTLELESSSNFTFDNRRFNAQRLAEVVTFHVVGTPAAGPGATVTVPFGATVIAAE